MGAHSPTSSASSLSLGGRAVATAGLAVLGLAAGAGAAFAGDAPSTGGQTSSSDAGSNSTDNATGEQPDGSECSVGGIAAGGTGTGSPDGVITNGQCTDEQNQQAAEDAEAVRNGTAEPDPNYDVDKGLEKHEASGQHDSHRSNCSDEGDGDRHGDRGEQSILSGVL